MIEQFVNFVIRPPRSVFMGDGVYPCWAQLTNARGLTIKCSHYVPTFTPENTSLPCVVYCHGNSGCRADANEAAVILLPANITVFTLDFSGSGLSGGDYVSLGWHEKEDLKCVVSYLRTTKQVSCIGLWGRSMGAVTSLLYGAEDSSIAGMVLDSAFTNLYDLMMELVDVYKIRVPKFTVKMAVQYMRKIIQKRAKFDIMDLNVIQFASKTFIPALFGHALNDMFIQPHHCDRIHRAYGGDKSIMKFDGDHNSPRPQSYYDSVSIFFYNTLRPPQLPVACSNKQRMGAFKPGTMTNESLFYEIINGLRGAGTNSCSSSADAPKFPNATTSVVKLLSESVNQLSIKNGNDLDFLLDENHSLSEIDGDSAGSHLQDKSSRQNEESCSCTSSNRESWGRCSSLGGASDGSFPGDISDKQENITVKALATPLRQKENKLTPKTKEKKIQSLWKKLNPERTGMGDSLSQRLKMCLGHSPRHKRTNSSAID
uniref:Serine aminopeptidase S33 domain-containing protein n=1 Tax=Leersia perrieri TaxID=77586 RepID=A0A0D9VDD4_9ORYZ